MGIDIGDVVRMGVRCKRNGDFEQALYYYNKALELEPGSFDAHYSKGKVKFITGEYLEAQVSYYYAARLAAEFVDFDLFADDSRNDFETIKLRLGMQSNIYSIRDDISRHIGYARMAYQFKENFDHFENVTKIEIRQSLDNYHSTINNHFIKPITTVSSDALDYYEKMAAEMGLNFMKDVSGNNNDKKLNIIVNSILNRE